MDSIQLKQYYLLDLNDNKIIPVKGFKCRAGLIPRTSIAYFKGDILKTKRVKSGRIFPSLKEAEDNLKYLQEQFNEIKERNEK